MSDLPSLPSFHSAVIDAILHHAGRATLPFQRAHREEQHATAFWFNELVATSSEGESVRQYLVTASEPARIELAEFTLRAELCAPSMSAEKLMMTGFADGWIQFEKLGVAVMPTAGLHAHGVRKGWSWTTDEITDGVAATAADIAGLGERPVPAYLLGHDVEAATGARLQAVVVGEIARTDEGRVQWLGELPPGCVGAPVFTGFPLEGNSFKLVCVGVALPGDGTPTHRIAPFDEIRTALHALPDAVSPTRAAATDTPGSTTKRRWWWRHGIRSDRDSA